MSGRADGCGRTPAAANGSAIPLTAATADPVVCRGCGNVFGRGAEAGTLCPYCGGSLRALSRDRELIEDPTGGQAA